MGFSAGISAPGFQLRSTLKLFSEALWSCLLSSASFCFPLCQGSICRCWASFQSNKRHIPEHVIRPAWAVFKWPNLLLQTEGKEDMDREASGNTNSRDSKVTVMMGTCFPAVTRLPWVHQDSGSCFPPPSHQKLQAAFWLVRRFRGTDDFWRLCYDTSHL